ncbi:hypothetical protein NM688_g3842 [Phlebia brevispora]|uniref:Uncharacterized protein n=1 Tax=Phlebia brevispora TaxID=194682 RepID=A0ACC1T4B5_9APHY|nr:hypothetical protein NM688_g3842 [Phlebia brevispora]
MVLTAQPCRYLTRQVLSPRQFSTSTAASMPRIRTRGKLTFPQLNEKLNAIAKAPGFTEEIEEDEGQDATGVGHLLLDQQRQMLHYMRLIENEMPQLVVRSISYGGEEHPAALKRTIVTPVALLPLKDSKARLRLKVLAGPRWSQEPPKDAGVGKDENLGKHGFVKISCEDFPKAAQNLKWASDVLDRLIAEANNPRNKMADVPLDTRHLDAKARKAKKGEHVRGRGGVRPSVKDFPKEWLPDTRVRTLHFVCNHVMLLRDGLLADHAIALLARASNTAVCGRGFQAYSLPETLDKLDQYTRQAQQEGAQLAVFPEAFIGGYPKFSLFGVVVGDRTPEGRDEFVRYHSAAIEVPGSLAVSRIEAISKETGVFLVVGVIERDQGTLYCTAVFVDPVQGYVAKHRKLVPTAMERVIWGQGGSTTLPVFEVSFASKQEDNSSLHAKISATICWENYMPLLRTYYYSKGVQIYCAPTVDARPVWQHTMNHIALEGRCFVLSACQYAEEKDFPAGHAVADPGNRAASNVMIAGGSVIIGPLGNVLAGPLLGKEGCSHGGLGLG